MITLACLDRGAGVRHGFFTRGGGVSSGLYASLNCGFGSGDEPDRVTRNRAAAMALLDVPADRLVTLRQIHSANVATVESPWPPDAAPRGDAMVTRLPGIALGILTADCAPVLFCDPVAKVIGAAHGGWRGALAGIIEATVEQMEALGAERLRIRAGIGPCIAQASYEVGPEFPQQFISAEAASERYFVPAARAGHFMFDLPGYVEHRLARAGVAIIERSGHDTVAENRHFFSYRGACLRDEPVYGRGLSAIVLEG